MLQKALRGIFGRAPLSTSWENSTDAEDSLAKWTGEIPWIFQRWKSMAFPRWKLIVTFMVVFSNLYVNIIILQCNHFFLVSLKLFTSTVPMDPNSV